MAIALAKAREDSWADGFAAGKKAALEEIINLVQNGAERPVKPPRRREIAGNGGDHPSLPLPGDSGFEADLKPSVLATITELSPTNPQGLFPDAVAEKLQIPTRTARLALKALTEDGSVRTAGRGRYLAASTRDPTPLPSDLIARAGG